MTNDETGITYLGQFYQDIQILNSQFSNYRIAISELKAKNDKHSINKKSSILKVDDDDLQKIVEIAKYLRYYVNLSYIEIISISDANKDKIKINENLKSFYGKLGDVTIPNVSDVESYVIEINKILANSTMFEILSNQASFYKDMKNKSVGKT